MDKDEEGRKCGKLCHVLTQARQTKKTTVCCSVFEQARAWNLGIEIYRPAARVLIAVACDGLKFDL